MSKIKVHRYIPNEDLKSGYNLPDKKPEKVTVKKQMALGRLKLVKAKHG